MPCSCTQNVVRRHLKALDLTQNIPPEELKSMADFMATQVGQMSDHDICYAAYVTTGCSKGDAIISRLKDALFLGYRKALVGWMEYALVKRANMGGGGVGIKKLEDALARFTMRIPEALIRGTPPRFKGLKDNEYLQEDMLWPIAQKIFAVIQKEAREVGVLGTPGKTALYRHPVILDPATKLWIIPPGTNTFPDRGELPRLGFRWNPNARRWEAQELEERAYDLLDVQDDRIRPGADVDPERVAHWYFKTWLPQNIDRFSTIFTNFARSKQTSYKILFSLKGDTVDVSFKRNISTARDAVEELRYRYIGRHGRESWLEVMDRFTDLVRTTNPRQLPSLIDRMNNLQHSNGLFLEQFPNAVQRWYIPFLNAKANTTKGSDLARHIWDADLRGIVLEACGGSHVRDEDQAVVVGKWHLMDKMRDQVEGYVKMVNWRKQGYPRYRGTLQVDRFDPRVQGGLRDLEQLSNKREELLSIDVPEDDEQAIDSWMRDTLENESLITKARQDLHDDLLAQQRRELREPGHAEEWERRFFPDEFLERFPWAAKPEHEQSLVQQFHTKYSTERVASRYLERFLSSSLV